jgi:hypothetical protein
MAVVGFEGYAGVWAAKIEISELKAPKPTEFLAWTLNL